MDEPSSHPRSNRFAARISPQELTWLIAAGALLTLLRLHAFDLPLETDECNYAYIAKRLLAGDRLYVDVWDHQPFGVFALFAGVIALFGDAPTVFRCMALMFSLASLALIYAIARRCAGRTAAVMAAGLFAVASSDPGTAGEGCNREIYINTLVLAAWYLALRGRGALGEAPRRLKPAAQDVVLRARGASGGAPDWSVAASGVALAVASSLKTVVAVHWLFLAVWLAVGARRHAEPGRRTRAVIVSLALFGAGPALLWLGSLVYFAGTGRLHEFIDAVFLFNLGYGAQPERFFQRFLAFFTPPQQPFIFDSALGLWIGGLGGTLWLTMLAIRQRKVGGAHATALPVVLLAVASYVAACLPGRSWPHYYYLLIPALVLTSSVAIGHPSSIVVGSLSGNGRRSRRAGIIAPGLFGVLAIWLMATEWTGYVSQPPFGITVHRYNSRDFWGRAHGERVRRVTDPTDEIFVYGNEAEIYYYANRRCASRYTMITGIGAGYPGFQARRTTMLAELRRRRPRLILVLFDEQPFDEWIAFLKEDYSDPIGWDFHDRTGEKIMFVVARKDAPVEPVDWDWDRSSVGGWFLGEKR